jgi:head-tail adaptor
VPFPIQPLRAMSEQIVGMRDTAEIQRYIWVTDEEGREVQTWSTIATAKCRLTPLGGTEIQVAGRLAPDANLQAFFPVGTEITTEDRLKVGDTYYEVEYVARGSEWLRPHESALVSTQEVQE